MLTLEVEEGCAVSHEQKSAKSADVTPEELVHDYLIGMFEVEKLQNGFQAPVSTGEPCEEHRHLAESSDSH
jgi:hypothetical protein